MAPRKLTARKVSIQEIAPGVQLRHEWPPNIRAIRETFGSKVDSSTIFTYAPNVYRLDEGVLPPQIIAHELVHIEQQGDDPAGWWERYLEDPGFRLEQELEAHIVEFTAYKQGIQNRNARAQYRWYLAARLSGLYGTNLKLKGALSLIGR